MKFMGLKYTLLVSLSLWNDLDYLEKAGRKKDSQGGVRKMEAKGRKVLKVVGIIMIVIAAIGLISSLISLLGASALISMGVGATITWVSIVVSLIFSGIELAAGIFGVKNCNVPEKAQTCLIFGVVLIVLQVIGTAIGYVYSLDVTAVTAAAYGTELVSSTTTIMSTVIGLIIGLVLPVLYIYGASLNKKSE